MNINELTKALKAGKSFAIPFLRTEIRNMVRDPDTLYEDWIELGRAIKFSLCGGALREVWLSQATEGTHAHKMGISLWHSFKAPEPDAPELDAAEILASVGAGITEQGMSKGLMDFAKQSVSINIDSFSINHTNYTYPPEQNEPDAPADPAWSGEGENYGCAPSGPLFSERYVEKLEQANAALQGIKDGLEADVASLESRCQTQSRSIEHMQVKEKDQASKIDAVYRERNLLAIALARMALRSGLKAGWAHDDKTSRLVVYVELDSGNQVSWHMDDGFCNTPGNPGGFISMPDLLPQYFGHWDGKYLARRQLWPKMIDPNHRPSVKEPTFEVALAVDAMGREYAAGIKVTGAEIARWADGTLDFIKGK